MGCKLCPRQCNINRSSAVGFCGAPNVITVAKSMLHYFEEPVISGTKGSGAIFFSGCNLRCCFCQNRQISCSIVGQEVDGDGFFEIMEDLAKGGAHNINLVTATPYVHLILDALKRFKREYGLPVIYNCGGYESVETIRALEGVVDVYLPDYKYFDSSVAKLLSQAENYPVSAQKAISEMVRQQPEVVIENGLIKRGVIIRHLVLPSYSDDSVRVIKDIACRFPTAWVSLMSQYTPEFNTSSVAALDRKITTFEYNKVLRAVQDAGLEGFCQDKTSASSSFTPDFEKK